MNKIAISPHLCVLIKLLAIRLAGKITANGVEVVKGDTPVTRGNIMFVSEVLFVDDTVVGRLHEEHRDKETPPLLAFPWFGSQFLSHAFLSIESDKRFMHITRFLNVADLVPHIPGAGNHFCLLVLLRIYLY